MEQQPNKPEIDGRFQLLLTLLALLKDARHKVKKTELEFLMVNQTFNLVRYRHCVFWERHDEAVTVGAVSGLVHVDPGGPYAHWLPKVIENVLRHKIPPTAPLQDTAPGARPSFAMLIHVKPEDAGAQATEWKQWVSAHALMVLMKDRHGKVVSGLWLDRDEPFTDLETAILEDLVDGYAYGLHRFNMNASGGAKRSWKSLFGFTRSNVSRVLIVLGLIMLIPVRMSATAPAEIIARDPEVVSVPFDGAIETVEVVPGQAVKEGDVLIHLDSTILSNRTDIVASEMQTAEIALRKTERESLADKSKLADLAILRSQLEQKSAESLFAQEMLQKSDIRAGRDGVVIFSDASSLRGRPVRTGEQIMLLADPADTELLIRVPVEAMIEINEAVPAKFFLNVTPLGSARASYDSIGYQATPDPDGLMTYKIKATFAEKDDSARVGWTGTAKIYGDWTVLGFNILRRPIVTLRRKMGI